MAEVLAPFYTWVRDNVIADLTRIQLLDSGGVVQLSLTTADARVAWGASGNPLKLTVTLDGGSADTTGKTLASIRLYRSSDTTHATPFVTEAFTAFTMEAGQTYVIELNVEIPDIP